MSLLSRFAGVIPPALRRLLPGMQADTPKARSDMMALRPVRNRAVTWAAPGTEGADPEAEGIRLIVPRRDDKVGRFAARFFQVPDSKTIELDQFGSQIWDRCDGSQTVDQLVRFTCEAYKLNRRQGEISVVQFMKMLTQRRLIGFVQGKATKDDGGLRTRRKRERATGRARRRH